MEIESNQNEIDSNSNEIEVIAVQSLRTDPAFENHRIIGERWLTKTDHENSDEMDNINFQTDRIELMIDVRNYRPEDIKCTVQLNAIEITAIRRDTHHFTNNQEKTISTTRNYQLNRNIIPQQAVCVLSNDGILLITVPWA